MSTGHDLNLTLIVNGEPQRLLYAQFSNDLSSIIIERVMEREGTRLPDMSFARVKGD